MAQGFKDKFQEKLTQFWEEKLKPMIARKQVTTPQVSMSEAMTSGIATSQVQLVRQQGIQKPAAEWTYKYIIMAIAAFAIADLGILYVRDMLLPTSAPPSRPIPPTQQISKLRHQYDVVTKRNIFNSDGVIPPALSQPSDDQNPNLDGPASPTSLPLALVGTIVHKNPAKSVATLEIKSGSPKILPYLPNDDIEGLATLLRVDRKRAIFRNNQNGRLEYAEIKDKGPITFGMKSAATPAVAGTENFNFTLPRTEVNNYIKNLPDLLQQARAEPNTVNGRIDGFKIMDIMPGSVYEKLGVKVNDIIKSVNGEPLDSPAKAMELYQQLRNSNQVAIEVERGGRMETLNFTIVN